MRKILFLLVLSIVAYTAWSHGRSTINGKGGVKGRNAVRPAAASNSTAAKTRAFDDPYAEFRDVSYSNDGLVSEQDEVRLGAKLHAEVLKKFKLTDIGEARLTQIGRKTAASSQRPKLVYHFYVVSSREINAFSGPGGYIYVTTAVMKLANDDELAAVVAHEIGHVVARHSLKSIQKSEEMSSLSDWFGSLTGIAGKTAEGLGKAAANIVGNGLLAVHTREEEREADFLGVRCASKAGYNPNGMVSMFRKLQIMAKDDSGLLGSLFNDHPDVQERIDNTEYEISRMRRS